MGSARKGRMRGFLRRHAARLLAKRSAAGQAESEVLQRAQVVLCTCTAAADPQIVALPPFDLAILDEAGQATQPNPEPNPNPNANPNPNPNT